MKLKELKHNHSLTDLLKILIFSVLMITPLLSVATRCLYVICNKNAYQSAEITQTTYNRMPKYTQGDINSGLEEGKIYHFIFENNVPSDIFNDVSDYLEFQIVNGNITSYTADNSYLDDSYINNDDYINYLIEGNEQLSIHICKNGIENNLYFEDISELSFELDILILENHNVFDLSFFSNTTYQDYIYIEVESTTLDNVFEYSVNKLQESQVINWTANTGVYTGVSAMTTQLGITGAVIPMLITYWFLLTIIYVIIDIVLKLFTVLTHLIGSKTT